jgi:hypothetical protein
MSPTKTASSASLSTATGGAVPAALSYSAEQALIADADTFLHTLGWGLRLPARVQADAALSLRKYAALVPLQQPQPFIIPPVLPSDGGGDAFTPSSSPATFTPSAYSSTSFLGGLELVALLSPAPPQGLYLLATAALFLAAKAGDTPRKLNDVSRFCSHPIFGTTHTALCFSKFNSPWLILFCFPFISRSFCVCSVHRRAHCACLHFVAPSQVQGTRCAAAAWRSLCGGSSIVGRRVVGARASHLA